MKIFKEFKEFAIKGNVLDLAIGVMIGTAFNKIVSSLVNDVIMPPIGWLSGGMNFANYKWYLHGKIINENGQVIRDAVSINYGSFLQVLLDFLIVALTMFIVVKAINKIREKQQRKEKKQAAASAIPEEIQLLREIRDELRKK